MQQTTRPRLWRQGDILFQECERLPEHVKRQKSRVLVHGESSGHMHYVADRKTARIFQSLDEDEKLVGTLYLDVFAERAEILHPEHGTITLEKGVYRVWRQREFQVSGGFRMVAD